MRNYHKNEQNDKSESIWSTIINVIQFILSIGLLIGFLVGLIAPILNGRYDDWLFLILLGAFYLIVDIIGEGVLSLFD